jgi:hypothetical protein
MNNPGLVITVQPAEPDLTSTRNVILEIDMLKSSVTATANNGS